MSQDLGLSLGERALDQVQACLRKRIKLIYSPETIGRLIRYCYGRARDLTDDETTRIHCGLCQKTKIVSIVLPEQFSQLYYLCYSPQKGLWLVYHQNTQLASGTENDPVMTTRFSRAIRYRTRGYDHATRYVGYYQILEKKCILRPLYTEHPDKNLCRSMQKQSLNLSKPTQLQHSYDLSKGFLIVGTEGLVYFNSRDPLIFFASLLRPLIKTVEGDSESRDLSLSKRVEVLEILAEIIPDVIVQFLKNGRSESEYRTSFLPLACEEFIDELVEIFRIMSDHQESYRALRRAHPDVAYFRLLEWFNSYYRLESHSDERSISRSEVCEYMARCGFNFGDELTSLIKNALVGRQEFLTVCGHLLESLENERLETLAQCLASL